MLAGAADVDYPNAPTQYMRRDAEGNPLTDQKRWERMDEVKYVVQSCPPGDLSLRAPGEFGPRHSSRPDEVRLIVEYPLAIL